MDRKLTVSAPKPKIIAFAGRRIDAADAPEPRFPATAESAVADRIRALFEETGATVIVASAACGSHIIALEVAGQLGLERHVILPFDRPVFRESSVTDRPGDWGGRYDAILDSLDPDAITVLRLATGTGAYERTNNTILDLAADLAGRPGAVLAVIAWNGETRGDGDITAQFAERARMRGMNVTEIDTSSNDMR
jgi:hypothetical protein